MLVRIYGEPEQATAVLEFLVAEGRWLEVADYLQRGLTFHREEAEAAVAYPDGDDAPCSPGALRAAAPSARAGASGQWR
ncbi:hypothetical protein PAHAL_5G457500 [Panicum hallii]|uniref:Uncharacterized protein n=1 Tax=Panicum hallii TaxID=206008 RepID=A0A2S3HXD1_9POAL|nr:hypothetical protein PAHAL_5G457500 [Panicum hallii]